MKINRRIRLAVVKHNRSRKAIRAIRHRTEAAELFDFFLPPPVRMDSVTMLSNDPEDAILVPIFGHRSRIPFTSK